MEKPAATDHPVHDLIRDRWSPRAFSGTSVTPAELGSLFEAARWAASCFNEQPWRFVVAHRDDGDDFDRILQCLVEGNRSWAQEAGVLAIGCAKRDFSHKDTANAHAEYDLGQAVAQLALQATASGLVVHQMAGFSRDRAREDLAVPDGFDPVVAFAIGRQGDVNSLPGPLAERERAPRQRRPLDEMLFHGRFGRRSPAE